MTPGLFQLHFLFPYIPSVSMQGSDGQAKALHHHIRRTIYEDLPQERDRLMAYDEACAAVADILALSGRDVTLFVTLRKQQRGRLSQTKRKRFFAEWSDRDIAESGRAVQRAFGFHAAET